MVFHIVETETTQGHFQLHYLIVRLTGTLQGLLPNRLIVTLSGPKTSSTSGK